MRQPAAVEEAMGLQLQGLVRQLNAVCQTLEQLEQRIDEVFTAHPDAKIVTSVPGLGVQLGARLLAEMGDDRRRFADARALRAFAGAAPVTRASGKSSFVRARRAKNDRIAATGYVWALAAVRHDAHWNARYRARREAGDRHVAALRRLFHLMLGKAASLLAARHRLRHQQSLHRARRRCGLTSKVGEMSRSTRRSRWPASAAAHSPPITRSSCSTAIPCWASSCFSC